MENIREKQIEVLRLVREAEVMQQTAKVLEAEINLEIVERLRDEKAPVDYSLDIWGDGEVKPAAQCKMQPDL